MSYFDAIGMTSELLPVTGAEVGALAKQVPPRETR